MNIDRDIVFEHIDYALSLNLPVFTGGREHQGLAVIVCSGPSLDETWGEIAAAANHPNARVFAVNAAHDLLIERGLPVHYHVIGDGQAGCVDFVRNARKDVHYLIASQCHPDLFDALKGKKVCLWHSWYGDDLVQYLRENAPPTCLYDFLIVNGGVSGGMQALGIAYCSRFRKIDCFGLDGSFEGPKSHAVQGFEFDSNKNHLQVIERHGREFLCAQWMQLQLDGFEESLKRKRFGDTDLAIHGDGVMAWVLKNWKERASLAAADPQSESISLV